ncbi:ferredoxin [Malaciobacter molluscorum LMG 25693]|uniref:Ferredoxin n=1 Tax=Malaciobacter molluscorum LMG 25693 TaxID=870501 RepID=A0A2G1DJY3_9BACT|nr:4Fe-4S dicluster domain-containing protein [Malaciobacter molluscorum]AXX91420.1 ferredoxin-type protein [Malaciobacter molluscorum LMG 25693]PHO18833.1 ferredoxin [Malaciobacter molluscorum LMG 25693]
MKRRDFFSSFKSSKKEEKIIRPPYFEDESLFKNRCLNCEGLCANICEEKIILIQEDKTPKLDFNSSGCTYCDECANICPNEVLDIKYKKNINTNISIDILKCLSWNQTMCFSCKDPCLDDAIDFLAMFRPEINSNCTSCGFCIKYCPVEAIQIGA